MKHVIHTEVDVIRHVFEGELDMHVAQELRSILRKSMGSKPKQIVLDLGQVPFIDSSVVATIVEAFKLTRQYAGVLKIANCQETVRDTFDIAGLTQLLGIQ